MARQDSIRTPRSNGFRQRLAWVAVATFITLVPMPARSAHAASPVCPQVRGPDGPTWTDAEFKVWSSLCRGQVADLTAEPADARVLTPQFLLSVLMDKPWKTATPWQGVRIKGAVFRQPLELDSVDFDKPLWLENSTFDEKVFLSQSRFGRLVSLDQSKFAKPLYLNAVNIGAGLFLRGIDAKDIQMWSAEVSGPLFLMKSRIGNLLMQLSHIRGDVVASDARIEYLQMSSTLIDGSVVAKSDVQGGMSLGTVKLEGAKVGGRVEFTNVTFTTPLTLAYADVAGNLKIAGASLPGLDLSGATIRGELALGDERDGEVQWTGSGMAVLRNAFVRAIRVGPQWPGSLDLRGFTYQVVTTSHDNPEQHEQELREFAGWLERSKPFSPQPYHELAERLAQTGAIDQSREILYQGEERERSNLGGFAYVWKWLLNWTIGYGYHLYFVWIWVGCFLLVGTLVVRWSGEAAKHNLGTGFWYSFDLLLPLVRLREQHYDVDLKPGVRHYFYFHKLTGYVLASFLIAGLSRLVR